MEALTVMTERFWKDHDCHIPGGGLALIECGGGSVVFPTSGTTGPPKWIVVRKDALLHSARAVNGWLGVDAASVWALALPMTHVGGFGVVARAYAAGCRLAVFQGKWDAVRFAEWSASEGVTHASLVPTQVHDLLAAGLTGSPTLRAVVVGGGRLSPESGQAARDAGWPVLASYGMTETCSQVATQKLDALGKRFVDCPLEVLPIWETETTEKGLLRLRGDALFCGIITGGDYHPRQEEWYTTKDRVKLSGNKLRVLGRADSLVKVVGELVDVEVIEKRFMETCPGKLREGSFAVVTLPDARRENRLVAVFEGEVLQDCIERYNKQTPGPERITECIAVAEFPRTTLGKIQRGILAKLCGQLA